VNHQANLAANGTERRIAEHGIDLWCVRCGQIADVGLLDEYRARLPREEVEQADRFIFDRSRQEYLIARMLVRTTLSHYTGCKLEAWQFVRNAYGKPAIAAPAGVPLSFNLSHAEGLVVCAVTAGSDVGVDTERLDRAADHLTLARRYFAPSEATAITRAPPSEQSSLFFRFWTLKEAFIKAQGVGLSIPLADVEFSLSEGRPPQVAFAASLTETPGNWQFGELLAGKSHRVAVAARMPGAKDAMLRVRHTMPLQWADTAIVLPWSAGHFWQI
jgi:4'-phosphopantetheinyl transferase